MTHATIMLPVRDLSNPKHCNWVKAGTALKYFTDGLRKFIEDDLRAHHGSILQDTKTKLTSLGKDLDVCNECSVYNILPCFPPRSCENGKGNCRVHLGTDQLNKPLKCKKDFCQIFYEQIKDNHVRRKPSWRNTTAQRWSSDYIELAKCFLSENEANRKVKTVQDIDTIGLLDILENSTHIGNSLSTQVKDHQKTLYSCKEVRRAVFHTENFELSDEEVEGYINDLICLLEDKKKLCSDSVAKEAVSYLKQLREGTIKVTLQTEVEVRNEAWRQIQLEKANISVKDEQIEAVGQLRKFVKENIKDVNEQYQSVQLFSTEEQNFNAMDVEQSMCQSIAYTQEKVEQNLEDFSRMLKDDVKQLVDEALAEFKTHLNENQGPFVDPQNQFDKIKDHLCLLDNRADSLEQSFSSMRERLNKFERLEELHKQDMDRQAKLSDYLRRRDAMQEQLCKKYEKRVSRVNIPCCSGISVDLMRVHEEQHIKPLNLEGCGMTSNDNIQGYRDLLCKDGRLCQKVALLGNMGHGKTLKCQRLIQDWISAVRKVKSNQRCGLSEDELFLSQFSLIFYIQLEHAVEDCSVFEMICRQTFGFPFDSFPDTQSKETMLEAFKMEPEQCLIIIDSLDKWNSTNLMTRKGLHNDQLPIQEITGTCPTLITSRHCKFNAILHTLAPKDFDNIFEVYRLKDERQAAENLIKIFSEADQSTQESVEYEGIHSFLLQSAICGLRDIPAILHYIIWSVFTCQSLQESQTEMVSRIIVHLFDNMNICDKTRIVSSTSNTGEHLLQKKTCYPEVFRNSDIMDRYTALVSKLSRAAFHDLFSSGDQSPLILTESEVRNYFLKEELEEALKSGILIQRKAFGSNLKRRMQLSFLCESLQQFFAALHVAGSDGQEQKDLVDKLLEFCVIEDRIYRVENFLLFVFCMVPDLCNVVSKSYFKRKSTDLTILEILDRFKHLLKRFVKELNIFNRENTKKYLFYMDTIKLSMTDFSGSDEAVSLKLYKDNIGNLKKLTAITDVDLVDSSIHTDEQLTWISGCILKHLASASCLVKLHLANIYLDDGGSALCSLTTLEDLHLENVRSTDNTVLNLTNCRGLQILKCNLLENMKLTVSSDLLEIIHFHNCTSVNLTMKQVSDSYMYLLSVKFGFFTTGERRTIKSFDCDGLKFCAIDFHDISVYMDALDLNRCSDCKFTFDHVMFEDDDPISPKDSSLLDYLPDFSRIWSNPGEHKISSINSVSVNNCKRVKLHALGIVSSCVVENCTDIEVLFKSNEKDRDGFAESQEEVRQLSNLKVIRVENIMTEHRKSRIKFLRLPLSLEKMLISNCSNCDILFDCFDQDNSLAKAMSYFIKSSKLDSCLQSDRKVYMNELLNCNIRLQTTNIALNMLNIEYCQSSFFAFEQIPPDPSLLQNPGHIPSLKPIVYQLKCSHLSGCRLDGLGDAVVKNIILQSCELVWGEIELKEIQSLHIERLPDSAMEICRSLTGCRSIRNLVCRQMSHKMMSALETLVPSLPNLTSVDLSDKGDSVALVHSLTMCHVDSINIHHVDCKSILELDKYKSLKHLCLNMSNSSCATIVMKTLPKLKHLKGLEFTHCSDDALQALGNLSEELKSVEQFKLSHCQRCDSTAKVLQCVSAMPKLKKLTLNEVPAEMLLAIQKYKMKYLEIFEIGPVLEEVIPHHLCFLLNQPKLQKIVCCGLDLSALSSVIDIVSKMQTSVSFQMNKMEDLVEATLGSLKCVQQVDVFNYQDLQFDSVASVLNNCPCSVKFLCLGGTSCSNCAESSNPPQRNSMPEVTKIKQTKLNFIANKDLEGVIPITWNITTLELSHINLNSVVIKGMENLKTVKELKLNCIKEVDVELLGRFIGILSVKVLTLSNIVFKESELNLSNAYRLRMITLQRIYMHTQTWIHFFQKLPKLLDARESRLLTVSDCDTRKKAAVKINEKYASTLDIYSRIDISMNNSCKEGSSAPDEVTVNSTDSNTVNESGEHKKERCGVHPISNNQHENISVIYSRTNQEVSISNVQGAKLTTESSGKSKAAKTFQKSSHVKTTAESDKIGNDVVKRGSDMINMGRKNIVAGSSQTTAKVSYNVARDQVAIIREHECIAERPRDMDPHEVGAAAATEKGETSRGSEFVVVDIVERRHSTCVKRIELSSVCITREAISAVSNLALFSKEHWSCIRMADPAVYDGTLSLL